jgi:hypothetical protein
MIWLFERDEQDLRIENFVDSITGEYVLTLRHPGGSRTVERYPNSQMLEARLEALESSLNADRWRKCPPTRQMKNTWQL